MTLHSSTGCEVPLTCLLFDSQPTVHLITNEKILVKIRTVQGKDAIRVNCDSSVKIVNSIGDSPWYDTIWYKPTGISNILFISKVTKKFRVVLDSEGGKIFRMVLLYREVRFHLIPKGLYYFYATDRDISVLLLNKVSDNREVFTHREYEGGSRGTAGDASAWLPSGARFWEHGTFKHDHQLFCEIL